MENIKKKIILTLIVINIVFTLGMTFSYWANSILSNSGEETGNIPIGDWGIPIFTADEFYQFATKTNSVSTDRFYLAKDIDFTGFNWTYNASNNNVVFRGELNGNGKTISNLTITNTSTSYLYHGIFPRIEGARINHLTLYDVRLVTNPSSGTSQRAGLISGQAFGGTNVIHNIKLIDSSSQGSSVNGVGGLIGEVTGASTVLTISKIKANNLKIFSRTYNVGGLVGRISTSGSSVEIYDVDLKGDIYSNSTDTTNGSNAGGLVGYVISGGLLAIERAVLSVTYQNTLVTNVSYLLFGIRYLGGFIGYNLSPTVNVTIKDSFMTGSLYTRDNDSTRIRNVGTVMGRIGNTATLDNVRHSFVLYRTTTGESYTVTDQLGQMATVVSQTEMPDLTFWNDLYSIYSEENDYWIQDQTTGILMLDETFNVQNIGIPISNADEFYTFATNLNSFNSDDYYLTNNIDFSSFEWNYDASNNAVIFRGQLNGNGYTLSNLTITNNSTTYLYNGIFPRIDGAIIENLTFDNVQIVTTLSGTSQRAGLIAGNAFNGKISTIKNITIKDSGVQGNSNTGVGGLVGYVQTNFTILNIENIKATNFKVFNRSAYVGGLVGRVANTATININDIDFQGEVYSHTSSGYSGGLIGYTVSGNILDINRAIVEVEFINTLVTDSAYINRYSDRYIGGFVGYNLTASANINIRDSFFTGSLFNQTNTYRNAVGTVMGRLGTAATLSNTYYSYVSYRTSTGGISYTQTGQQGQMAPVVSETSMPTQSWWNAFFEDFYESVNPLWDQDIDGRPYLIR